MMTSLKTLLTSIFGVVALLFATVWGASADQARPLTVVELFTSQGCSSCPPADKFLGDLVLKGDSEDVLALSFHVDYWDNLGWPDPYSSADNTDRQRDYASRMNLRYVYTPQMIVQGSLQATGSDRRAIKSHIAKARTLPRIALDIDRQGNTLAVKLPESTQPINADVFMVVFDKEHTTDVKRGENRGKTITNRNVVRSLKRIGTWRGEASQISSMLASPGDACAIIVQSHDTGAILGAAKIVL